MADVRSGALLGEAPYLYFSTARQPPLLEPAQARGTPNHHNVQ